MRLVAISGSLRAGSSNAALLRAAGQRVPPDCEFVLYEGIGTLPHFNPDLDGQLDAVPPPVAALRELLKSADGIVISSPEYVHGIPGSLKNALDWLVSSGELGGKPVVLINASPSGGQRAQASLVQTLTVMMAEILHDASLTPPFARSKLDGAGEVCDPELAQALQRSMAQLVAAVRARL
jgi:NAD(P)H-dependent FMN reductase